MSCDQARELFSPHLDDQLSAAEDSWLQEHFGNCGECRDAMVEYRQVFALLRFLPTCQTDAPAPIPEAARLFSGGSQEMSPKQKALAAAAICMCAGLASFIGYSLGLGGGLGPQDHGRESAAIEAEPLTPSLPVMLSRPAGRRLRRAHDGLSNLAWYANEAPSISDAGSAVEAFDTVLSNSPLEDDVRALRVLDHNSLGTWQSDVHHFCDETLDAVKDVRRVLSHQSDPPATRLVRARRVMLERDIAVERLRKLSRVAHCFDALPWHSATDLGVVNDLNQRQMNGFSEALLSIMSGQSRRGVTILSEFQRNHPDSPLQSSALQLLGRFRSHWPRNLQIPGMPHQQVESGGVRGFSMQSSQSGGSVRIIIRSSSSAPRTPRSRKL